MYLQEVEDILAQVKYKDVEFKAGTIDDDDDDDSDFYLFLQCAGWEADNVTGEAKLFFGRKWLIPTPITKTDIVNTAFKAVMTWEEHEIREQFKYRGKSIYQPHFDPDELAELTEF